MSCVGRVELWSNPPVHDGQARCYYVTSPEAPAYRSSSSSWPSCQTLLMSPQHICPLPLPGPPGSGDDPCHCMHPGGGCGSIVKEGMSVSRGNMNMGGSCSRRQTLKPKPDTCSTSKTSLRQTMHGGLFWPLNPLCSPA